MPAPRRGGCGGRRLAVLALAVCVPACASQILLQPQFTRRGNGTPPRAERIELANASGARVGGFLASGAGDHGSVMVSGGNAMGKGQTWRYTGFLQGRGYRVMAFSFEGYDTNGGEAHLGSLLGDARVVYDYLRQRHPGEPIAYLASSISTAPALCLPSQEPGLDGVILEGAINLRTLPFQKLIQLWPLLPLLPVTLPWATIVSASIPGELSPGRCAEHAGQVPALFLHHRGDVMTPYAGARALFERYSGPKRFGVLEQGNRQNHLLLHDDRRAQALVLEQLAVWLAPEPPAAE